MRRIVTKKSATAKTRKNIGGYTGEERRFLEFVATPACVGLPQSFGRRCNCRCRRFHAERWGCMVDQGITVRPVPCNYNVIQPVSALSRRKRGFKSRRGRQFNRLQEKCLLSV